MSTTTAEAKAISKQLHDKIWLGAFRKYRCGVWSLFSDQDVFPFEVEGTLHSFASAMERRLSRPTRAKLHALSDWQLCDLIADMSVACETTDEVVQFLIERFGA